MWRFRADRAKEASRQAPPVARTGSLPRVRAQDATDRRRTMTNEPNTPTLESVILAAEQNIQQIEQAVGEALFASIVTPGNFRAAMTALQIAQECLLRARLACAAHNNLTAADLAVAGDPRA